MTTLKIIGLGVALVLSSGAALISGHALAFQEQKAGSAGAPAAIEAPAAASKELGLGTDTSAPKANTGTEVRIPGLGKLGVLPKMDFGLELLYGAADQAKQAEPPRGTAPVEDDLTIRGTVKHRW